MLKVMLVVFLATSLAQIVPSCGGGSESRLPGGALVIGTVESKRLIQAERTFTITVLSTEYDVPYAFWQQVNVGDLVRWDGTVWTIIRRGSGLGRFGYQARRIDV
jgi:hypothetical protein